MMTDLVTVFDVETLHATSLQYDDELHPSDGLHLRFQWIEN